MVQAQMKRSYFAMTVSCGHCQEEQVVPVQACTGSWSMAHQSVKCLKCEKDFEVMLADAIIVGPFFPLKGAA
jgi:ribosomal protein S27E